MIQTEKPTNIRVFSYGGGVQSTAALVLASQKKIDFPTFLFCNVGIDSENPATIEYIESYAKPFATSHGIQLIELQKISRTGTPITILSRIKSDTRSIGIPVRMSNGAPGNRSCTVDFKIHVVDKWLREQGAKKVRAQVGLGISLDEWQRMRTSNVEWKENVYPLIDLRLDRMQCMNIITSAGLPIPPKSSCWFCPFHRLSVWQEMRTYQPQLFEKAVALENYINERRETLGKDHVWLSGALKPLAQATTDMVQSPLFDEIQTCDSGGYCMA